VAGAPATGPGRSAAPGGTAEADVVVEVARLVGAGATTRDAVSQVARATGRPRRSVYQAVLEAREPRGPAPP